MDPFSIIVGTAGLADVCIRLTGFLRQAKDGFLKVDQEIDELSNEVTALRSISDLVKRSFEVDRARPPDASDQQILDRHWQATRTTLAGCQEVIEKLNSLLTEILSIAKSKYVRLNSLRKYLKQQFREDEFLDLRRKLNTHQLALQTSLAAVNLIYTRNSQSASRESFSELSQRVQALGADLQTRIGTLQENIESSAEQSLLNAVAAAKGVVPLASLNEHFSTPQTVSSTFTGRKADLNTLRQCFQAQSSTSQNHVQKRFVIYGLPGSGKTQFCCKYASDNKQSFWGIFWIDASSSENAKQSFATLARIGKVDPNERAVKSWLSSLGADRPWLLIVDNADEESFPVEQCYPDGQNGTILITTRNPFLKVQGTVGPRYFHFGELEESESIEILLKIADEPLPWSTKAVESAKVICKTLGYLPLALLHAGTTISGPLCTLENYLSFFEKNWNRIRKLKSANEACSVLDANAAIYSSYELIHDGIAAKGTQSCEDALELLKLFSFLHGQRIRVDIFLRAASNPRREVLEQERREQAANNLRLPAGPAPTWSKVLEGVGFNILLFLLKLGDRPVLPRMLSDGLKSNQFDELRLREALRELFQMSLIFANPDPNDDSYSMHPAVHLWVRERPGMTIADQAVWCQAAATVLTQAILLPPLGDDEEEEILRRDLLPHVGHVQHNEQAIHRKLLENRESRKRPWPVLQARFDRGRALQLIKFSLVYAQCDHLEAAERLQTEVADFAIRRLGVEHTLTMDVMLLLSSTYWRLTRGEDAAKLQKTVLDACVKVRGPEDMKTLKVMDAYGSSLWQQGRILEARKLHETAVEGLERLLGNGHIDTLRAMGNLGRDVGKDFHFTAAIKIHSKVVLGLSNKLGPSHLDTLIARDNLAMAYFDRAAFGYGRRGDLDRALQMEREVFEQRKEKLGREHLYTLWAGLNLARIQATRGETDEALSTFLPGHEIGIRNLGETHFAILFAKLHYGRILLHAKKYEEAETQFLEVIASHEGQRKNHPDRLLALFSLIKCRNMLSRQAETVVLLEELTERTKSLFGADHPWVTYLLDPQNLSKEPDDGLNTPTDARPVIPETLEPRQELIPVAMIAKYGHI